MGALIIDDSRAMRLILRQILQKIGLQVAEASNGREGLEQLRGGRPDVVLVDCQMPEMDGFAFLHAVRADPTLKDLHVIMITAEEEATHAGRARDAGADDLIVKPFHREVIRAKLDRLGITTSPS